MIPPRISQSRDQSLLRADKGWTDFFEAWRIDEFVLDPSRLTLAVGADRRGRQHVQERLPDEQVRHPDQQDLAQHRAVHDQYRHDAQLGRLPDRRAGQDRQELDDQHEDSSPAERECSRGGSTA